jgi:hypothetical protein
MGRIVLELQGGLGNQLFQLATAMRLAGENNSSLIIDKTHFLRRSTRNYEIEVLEEPLRFKSSYLVRFISKSYPRIVESEEFEPFQLKVNKSGSFRLKGYFQNRGQVERECLEISSSLIDLFAREIEKSSKFCCEKSHVGVHIRRGDYENVEINSRNFGVLSDEYFLKVIRNFNPTNTHLVLYTESESVSLMEMIPKDYQVSISLNRGVDALVLLREMSENEAFIMSNSSLSWWAASVISTRAPEAIIYAPSAWFRNHPKSNNLIHSKWKICDATWQ